MFRETPVRSKGATVHTRFPDQPYPCPGRPNRTLFLEHWLGHEMKTNAIRALAVAVIGLAVVTVILGMVVGGDILMIAFGLCLAATSMELFRRAQAR